MTVLEASLFQPTVVYLPSPPPLLEQLLYSNQPQPKYIVFWFSWRGICSSTSTPILLHQSVHFTPARIWNGEVCWRGKCKSSSKVFVGSIHGTFFLGIIKVPDHLSLWIILWKIHFSKLCKGAEWPKMKYYDKTCKIKFIYNTSFHFQ